MATRHTTVSIHLGGRFVSAGVLEMDCVPGHVRSAAFRYHESYAARPDAVPVDPLRLPLRDGAGNTVLEGSVAEGGDLVGTIRDALPDGFGRSVLAFAAGVEEVDEFDCLVSAGPFGAGALAFGDPGDRRGLPVPLGVGEALAGYDAFVQGDRDSPEFRRFVPSAASLGGARPKAAVVHEGREWLAKFPKPDDTFEAIRVEAGVMRLAAGAGFDVPRTRVVEVDGRPVFLIERFDRIRRRGGETARVPFMSAMSATGQTELGARYGSYEDIAEACRRMGAPETDLADLFLRAAFNVMVGNDDDHLRNHGLLGEPVAPGWRLSPLYDVAPRPQASSVRKLAIYMCSGDADRASDLGQVVASAPAFGLGADEGAAMVEDLRSYVAANWEASLAGVGLSRDGIEGIAPCFAKVVPEGAPRPGW